MIKEYLNSPPVTEHSGYRVVQIFIAPVSVVNHLTMVDLLSKHAGACEHVGTLHYHDC